MLRIAQQIQKRHIPVPSVRTSSKSLIVRALELFPSSLFLGSCCTCSGGSVVWASAKCATNFFSCSAAAIRSAGLKVGFEWVRWIGCCTTAAAFDTISKMKAYKVERDRLAVSKMWWALSLMIGSQWVRVELGDQVVGMF